MSAFSLINNNLLMFLLLNFFLVFLFCFVCRNSWLLSYLFGTEPLSYLRGCLLGLSSQEVCQIRHNCQTLCCTFFFSFLSPVDTIKSQYLLLCYPILTMNNLRSGPISDFFLFKVSSLLSSPLYSM